MSPLSNPASRSILFVLLLLALNGPNRIEARETPIRVTVVAILATEKDSKVDPRLVGVAQEIQKLDPKLTGFRMSKMTCKSLPVGRSETFDLVADQKVTVTVKSGMDKEGWVQLVIAPPLLGEITYNTTCGKFLPIITRYRTKNKELLLLAIRVQPCNGK